jgi:glycosyltransferase involved in cell wall biosynthesis
MNTRVLVFIDGYLPGYKFGGPLQSIANLVDYLGDDLDFYIVTRDRDLQDPAAYPGIRTETWTGVGKAQVCYLPPDRLTLRTIARLMRDTPHDWVYLNSFHSPRMTVLPLLAMRLGLAPRSPCVLAPRGEFSTGALALKARQKQLFRGAAALLGLYRAVTWQASTVLEAEDIRREMNPKDTALLVALDLPRRSSALPAQHLRSPEAPLRVAFLSRISPMKNLGFALQVLAQVRAPVVFSIFGPREDLAYWHSCAELIATLPAHIHVEYCGPVEPARVIPVLSTQDLFFLPTLAENYGHVIAEALQAGLPVLLSDQTPWRGLAAKGIGRDLPLDYMAPFARYIDDLACSSTEEISLTRQKVRLQAALIGDVSAALDANRRLFAHAVV